MLPGLADKMHASTELVHAGQHVVPAVQVQSWVPWCGVLLDPATMQLRVCALLTSSPCFGDDGLHRLLHRLLHMAVRCTRCMDEQAFASQLRGEERNAQADFARLRGARVRDRVVRPRGSRAAARVPERTCGHLNAKLQPLLLDTDLNGAHRVAANIFEASAFAALKLLCYARCSGGEALGAHMVVRAVDAAVEYAGHCAPRAARGIGGAFCLPRCASCRLHLARAAEVLAPAGRLWQRAWGSVCLANDAADW
jgi:hypothetical protein